MTVDFLVAGVSALGLTVSIVYVLKTRIGWSGRRLIYAAIFLGQFFSLGGYLAAIFPAYAPLWQAIITGLVLTLASIGAWSGGKTLAGK